MANIAEHASTTATSVSAREAYLPRPRSYYAAVLPSVDGIEDPEPVLQAAFREHRRCFDAYVALLDIPGEKVEIPYESSTMPGYFFARRRGRRGPAHDHPEQRQRRRGHDPVARLRRAARSPAATTSWCSTVPASSPCCSNGASPSVPIGSTSSPRSSTSCRRTRRGPRPASRIYGISQAGYWVPRALAFEHRMAAAIVDPGVDDVSTSWLGHLPDDGQDARRRRQERASTR